MWKYCFVLARHFLVKLFCVFVFTMFQAENTPFAVIVYEISAVSSKAHVRDGRSLMASLLDRKHHEKDRTSAFWKCITDSLAS